MRIGIFSRSPFMSFSPFFLIFTHPVYSMYIHIFFFFGLSQRFSLFPYGLFSCNCGLRQRGRSIPARLEDFGFDETCPYSLTVLCRPCCRDSDRLAHVDFEMERAHRASVWLGQKAQKRKVPPWLLTHTVAVNAYRGCNSKKS